MDLLGIFDNASSIMTLVSLLTFIGIVWWTYGIKKPTDFDAAANLPFADDKLDERSAGREENTHG